MNQNITILDNKSEEKKQKMIKYLKAIRNHASIEFFFLTLKCNFMVEKLNADDAYKYNLIPKVIQEIDEIFEKHKIIHDPDKALGPFAINF